MATSEYDWTNRTVSLWELKTLFEPYEFRQDIFGLLKHVGLVPDEVESMPVVPVRLGLDENAIPVVYLASVAYEWDTWGMSTPSEFIGAFECELPGHESRDLISAILFSLGEEARTYAAS